MREPILRCQGAAAEIVAMGTIAAADSFGLPVSTMAANGSGVQCRRYAVSR